MNGWFVLLAFIAVGFAVSKAAKHLAKKNVAVAGASAPAAATPTPVATPTSAPRPNVRNTNVDGGNRGFWDTALRLVLTFAFLALVGIFVVYVAVPWIKGDGNDARPTGSSTEAVVGVEQIPMLPPLDPGMTSWREVDPAAEVGSPTLATGVHIMRCSTGRIRPSESDLGRLWTEAWPCPGRRWIRLSTAATVLRYPYDAVVTVRTSR